MSLSLMVVLVAAAAAVLLGRADAVALNCSGQYRYIVQQALSVREECGVLNTFDSCCEAHQIRSIFPTRTLSGIYEVTDVCAPAVTRFRTQKPTETVRCHVDKDDGGWLVIMRRDNTTFPEMSFNRTWTEYVEGFGDLNTEFWYGLEHMHCVTTRDQVDLQIVFTMSNGTEESYMYRTFTVGASSTNYRLAIGSPEAPEGKTDPFAALNGADFSTRDDENNLRSCAGSSTYGNGGGWWYLRHCTLNALLTSPHSTTRGLYWGANNYAQGVEMRVRSKTCIRPLTCD